MSCDVDRGDRQAQIDEIRQASLTLLAALKQASGAAFGSLGLTYGQAMLIHLVARGHQTPGELAARLGILGTALSGLVTNLVEEGLVERQMQGRDARRVTVGLTPAGQQAYSALTEAWEEHEPFDLRSFNEDELAALAAAVRVAAQRGLV